MYQRTQFLTLFYAIEVLLEEIASNEALLKDQEESIEISLWRARFFHLYDKQMTSNVEYLQMQAIDNYERYVNWRTERLNKESVPEKRALALLLVE